MFEYLRKEKLAFAFCILVVLLLGCTKFVQIPPPTTQLVTASVFNNSSTATSALTNIYQSMYNNAESENMAFNTGILGDELTNYSTVPQNILLYTNAMTAALNTFGPWDDAYNYIYQANAVIEGVQNNSAIALPIRNQLIGESLFIRAFWNFCLTNCYGDVPLANTTSYTVNASLGRTPQAQVYNQIINDLLDAQSLLNTNFIDASDTTVTTTDRTRPNKWAATALLARVYLYNKNYDSAAIEASAVINNFALFNLVPNLNDVFLVNSSEAIWQLGIPLPNSQNTPDGTEFILFGIPTACAISPQLISAFETGDQRRVNWIDSFVTTTAPIDTFYYAYKYKVSANSDSAFTISEYNMMLRLAEQYLIRAEAETQKNDLRDAATDLNVIRNRAGLDTISNYIASSQTTLLVAILHERQVELFTEWGNRWFDLIRTGNVNSVMGIPGNNVCGYKNGTWASYKALFPIPQSERNSDPNLTQNQGYN